MRRSTGPLLASLTGQVTVEVQLLPDWTGVVQLLHAEQVPITEVLLPKPVVLVVWLERDRRTAADLLAGRGDRGGSSGAFWDGPWGWR